jgi:hypothetical protein
MTNDKTTKEGLMARPDLSTLACVNPECHQFRHAGQGSLGIRKVYGHDHTRLLRCRTCGEEFSERRGSALFNTKLPEAKAKRLAAEALVASGDAYRMKRMVDIDESLRLSPQNARALYVQGIVLELRGNLSEAAQAFAAARTAIQGDDAWSQIEHDFRHYRPKR